MNDDSTPISDLIYWLMIGAVAVSFVMLPFIGR